MSSLSEFRHFISWAFNDISLTANDAIDDDDDNDNDEEGDDEAGEVDKLASPLVDMLSCGRYALTSSW